MISLGARLLTEILRDLGVGGAVGVVGVEGEEGVAWEEEKEEGWRRGGCFAAMFIALCLA